MNTPIQIPADQKLTVTLDAQHWGVIMAGLGELPQKVSGAVANMLMEALQAAAGGMAIPAATNGAGPHPPTPGEFQGAGR